MINHGLRMLAAVGLSFLSYQSAALAGDLDLAPPSFTYQGQKVVPVDFQTIQLDLNFDYGTRITQGSAKIEFVAGEAGVPMFDLVPNISSIKLNGEALNTSDAPVINDPTNATRFRILKREVVAGSTNTLEITYKLNEGISYSSGSVRAGFFMSDLQQGGRGYWEQYAPASFEFDQVQQTITATVTNATATQVLYVNGEVTELGSNQWQVVYPSYFTTSSFYFHLTSATGYPNAQSDYQGIEKTIPITVYSNDPGLINSGMSRAKATLAELEGTYGAFAHDRLVIYVTPDGGGMEHCGATMTSLWALEHELTHSWFARGVMPADGNAGWIDEAIASWRDDGYPRDASGPSGRPVNLGGFSPYKRDTTSDAYYGGAQLISQFDGAFQQIGDENSTGMRFILKNFFQQYKRETVSVANFQAFLEAASGRNLQATFDRFVYNRALDVSALGVHSHESKTPYRSNHHPRPFTKAELVNLR